MAPDPIDTTETIAELSRLLVSHENMQDVHQEVVQVVLCRVPAWAPPRSISREASTLAPPAAIGPPAGKPDETEHERGDDPYRRPEDAAVSPTGLRAAPECRVTPGAVMAAEMTEQPGRLAALLSRAGEIAVQVREVLPDPLAGTVMIARGSSDHAATTGRYLLELATGRPVASASPSLYTMYGARTDFTGFLVVGVSQSGHTPEIIRSVQAARAAGGRTVAVTNDSSSPLAQAADCTVCLDAGPERAVPATKTVTAELAVFALIAQAAGDVGFGPQVRDRLPGQVAAVLADPAPAGEVAGWLAGQTKLVTVARGLLYGAAAEAALKVEETTSLFATGYSAADLRHGPIAVASTRLPVLAFAHPGPALADVLELAADLRKRGADVRLAGPVDGSAMRWAAQAPEVVAPVLAVVRAQQLALALARQLGRDPDQPAGLRKVTAT